MKKETPASSCTCTVTDSAPAKMPVEKKTGKGRAMLKSFSSVLLSLLIAFFPKCPVCWAVYMSMFGSFGLTQLPYMKWLLPVLLVFLALHLYLVLRKAPVKGYGPFLLSLAGATVVLSGRFFYGEQWVLFTGMFFILSGSLWNSFAGARPARTWFARVNG